MNELDDEQRLAAEREVLEILTASSRPRGFVELRAAVSRRIGVWVDTGQMMTVLSRLVVRRRIVRRPTDPRETGRVDRLDVQLTDYHPAGRDPYAPGTWRDGVPWGT